jgi:hypothetical protein
MDLVKIAVTVPSSAADELRKAIGDEQENIFGEYSHCSYSITGTGRFTPLEGSHPTIGEVGQPTQIPEEKIEVTCLKSNAKDVIEVIKKVHPYETPVFDIYPLIDPESL